MSFEIGLAHHAMVPARPKPELNFLYTPLFCNRVFTVSEICKRYEIEHAKNNYNEPVNCFVCHRNVELSFSVKLDLSRNTRMRSRRAAA